jgi:hypothetical protein
VVVKVYTGGGGDQNSAEKAKEIMLACLRKGWTVEKACQAANRSIKSYEGYRKKDPGFRERADAARAAALDKAQGAIAEVPDFPEFCEQYLGMRLHWHQLQWFDLLEGREPRDLHPSQIYVPGDPDTIVVNTPPEHAKSTTITVAYTVWRICQDPNIRVMIVSKTQTMAIRFLNAIKMRLAESDTFAALQEKFGPPGGFAEGASQWRQDQIYVGTADSGEKDPTVQALGIGGHIYGTRTDLVIMDDCVDSTNHQHFANQIDWIQNIVGTRVADAGGRMLLIGTRLEAQDLYSEILKPEYYNGETSPWTYLTQPAVLEVADDPKDWVTLWPRTNRAPVTIAARKAVQQAEDGSWPMWDGPALAKKRRRMSPRNWSMVYMQEQVADDAVFKAADIMACIDNARYAGRMFRGQVQHRKQGMDGLYIVAGLDPAAVNHTAAVVIGLDRSTGVRWVLDVFNKPGTMPHELRQLVKDWTDRYGIQEWRIEKNAFQASIVQDLELQTYLHGRGALLAGHFTNGNKWDLDFGISSMATLFTNHEHGAHLIRLPSKYQSEGVRSLCDQLLTWHPETKGKTDCVMALWFAEIRCRELMATDWGDGFHLSTEFTSLRERESQMVIDIDYALTTGGMTPWDGKWSW